tara:strand:- start:1 stop:252 length:252 start_codon:yes stop_codon:yes gene_type:complete
MARRKTVQQRMRSAIDNESLSEYAWAILEQCRLELRDHKKLVTFAGGDIKNILNLIASKSLNTRDIGQKDESTLRQIKEWMDD